MKLQPTGEWMKLNGRTVYRNGVRYLGYSGTGMTFGFVGKKASAVFVSNPEKHTKEGRAWIGVFVKGMNEPLKRIELTQKEAEYVLYEAEEEKEVVLTIVKYSEPEFAACGVKEIIIDTDKVLPPEPQKDRKILMIGDSITCGYGVEGVLEDMEFRTSEENPMKAYSLLTARELNAEAQIVAWNGKGVISAYIGEGEQPDKSWLVPMLYEYTDAGCERDVLQTPKEAWEMWKHEEYQADLVTIYLGTNDASYTKGETQKNLEFQIAYTRFIERVHETQPDASILCMLGTMDQSLCDAVLMAVEQFKAGHEQVCIEGMVLPAQAEEDGYGTFWHPTEVTQKKTADIVVKKIRQMMSW